MSREHEHELDNPMPPGYGFADILNLLGEFINRKGN